MICQFLWEDVTAQARVSAAVKALSGAHSLPRIIRAIPDVLIGSINGQGGEFLAVGGQPVCSQS